LYESKTKIRLAKNKINKAAEKQLVVSAKQSVVYTSKAKENVNEFKGKRKIHQQFILVHS